MDCCALVFVESVVATTIIIATTTTIAAITLGETSSTKETLVVS
jgi:hypothetical protein